MSNFDDTGQTALRNLQELAARSPKEAQTELLAGCGTPRARPDTGLEA